eukprot:8120180-Prorocentrum_lima.AAC.1
MHLCTWILADDKHQMRSRLITCLCGPIRLWHGVQVKDTRSGATAKDQAIDSAGGGRWLLSLCATVAKLEDIPALSYV